MAKGGIPLTTEARATIEWLVSLVSLAIEVGIPMEGLYPDLAAPTVVGC